MGLYLLSGQPSVGDPSTVTIPIHIIHIPWNPVKLMDIDGSTPIF